MAEITIHSDKPSGKPQRKTLSTRVDLTPMVDLGFLLITFFIFTTAIAEPRAMKIVVPANGDSSEVAESTSLTFLLRTPDSLCFYRGNDLGNEICTQNSPTVVREAIRKAQLEVAGLTGDKHKLVVLIQPYPDATYGNVVDVLDEMAIMGVTRYVLVDGKEREK